ncbi:MAG: hypothetical protein E6H10_14940 [Bacteroidetes bacterium]|nr:MAG: hypothetical protein E6H10_14940 [Bacteroidota bacterium]
MNLRSIILAEHSKANCNRIVRWVGTSQKKFDELFNLFLTSEYRVNQRAAWPLSYCVINHPQFISKHLSRLVKNLHKPGIHDAVKRNTVRLLQHIEIPKKFHGEIMDICFGYLSSPDEPVAIKAFSLTILQNLSKQYPEIKNEIKLIIEERWEHETAAFHSRAKKFLKS